MFITIGPIKSCERGQRGKKEDMCNGTLPAAACTFESGHLTLVSGAGEGEVVSKKVGKEVRGAQG